ncbi:MAG: TIM44-like domain-containing protein [Nitrospira sp.]|nr:TIM44-like domain-containing protein [Nitrospira sp.]
MINSSKLIAVCIIASLVGLPTLSFAKARGGSGGGFSSGSRSGGYGSMGSRGSRTYQDNGAKPIEQSTTAKPATAPPPNAANSPMGQPAPATSPSWFQRNPLLAGIAGGLAGTWIGHMLFGATESSAKTTDTEEPASSSNSFGLVLLLMMVGAGALYYFKKVRKTPAPVFTGLSRSTATRGSLLDISSNNSSADRPVTNTAYTVTTEDKAAFQQLLIDIQSAWSAQDAAGLRRCLTPEMLSYFNTALAEDHGRGVHNHVEGVELLKGDVREAWSEETTDYATVDLRWNARDYTISTTIPRGEPGYLVEGSEETSTESCEVWTFVRVRSGQWLLSAIQQ